ncbi:hypothetical protein P7K49_012732 [Saguinus oedipus]|uniref:Uncharacterized protein n=1 Tax=Saguinus oedipus TaxID=9490 RepID=A0ABQ9VDW6_SAGOE|nr:hypothetical protein P7K49_012732 [Saguinus oedipus]
MNQQILLNLFINRFDGELAELMVKASIRTFTPREKRFVEDSRKLSKKILSRDVDRVKRITMAIWNTMQFLKSCFQWESTLRSTIAFMLVASCIGFLFNLPSSTSHPNSLLKLSMECSMQFWAKEENEHNWCLLPVSTQTAAVRRRGFPLSRV